MRDNPSGQDGIRASSASSDPPLTPSLPMDGLAEEEQPHTVSLAHACPPTRWCSRHLRSSSSQSSQGRHGLTPGLCLRILSPGEPMVVVGARKAVP